MILILEGRCPDVGHILLLEGGGSRDVGGLGEGEGEGAGATTTYTYLGSAEVGRGGSVEEKGTYLRLGGGAEYSGGGGGGDKKGSWRKY